MYYVISQKRDEKTLNLTNEFNYEYPENSFYDFEFEEALKYAQVFMETQKRMAIVVDTRNLDNLESIINIKTQKTCIPKEKCSK